MSKDAITLIEADHRTVEQLFAQLKGSSPRDPQLLATLVEELTVHATIEERVLYPAIRRSVDDGDDMVQEAEDEHRQVKDMLAKVQQLGPRAEDVDGLLVALEDSVQHHVEEEENDVLPALRESVGEDVLERLGQELEQAKEQAKSSGKSADQLVDLTREELYEKAKEAGIEGRSDMTKDELIKALAKR